jgi:hypothetical protein
MRGVINVNSQVLNYHSFIINRIFVSDPCVSRALLCALFCARAARRQGPNKTTFVYPLDDVRLPLDDSCLPPLRVRAFTSFARVIVAFRVRVVTVRSRYVAHAIRTH